VRVKVSPLHGGRGSWHTARRSPCGQSPAREVIPGSLPTADVTLVIGWIELNRDVILDCWNEVIDFDEMPGRLRRLP
jgi:hypothetical protein